METDMNETGVGIGSLSLLTLADLAIALQDQGEDHNYARNYDVPQTLDEQCLRVKEKDHNYSTCSRTELRGRAKYNLKRCSSEENLTTVSTSDNEKLSVNDFSLISKKSHSCEQVVTESSADISRVSLGDGETTNKLCSSWPKENIFKEFMNDNMVKDIDTGQLFSQQTVCDHTYARDESSLVHTSNDHTCTKSFTCTEPQDLFRNDHNYDIRGKFSFNDPEKLNSKKSKHSKCNLNMEQSGKADASLFSMHTMKNKLSNFDHNYSFHTIQTHQHLGSVESLDMDLSESDTDSCDETAAEEEKMYYKQMLNTQKDHPYSKNEILSF